MFHSSPPPKVDIGDIADITWEQTNLLEAISECRKNGFVGLETALMNLLRCTVDQSQSNVTEPLAGPSHVALPAAGSASDSCDEVSSDQGQSGRSQLPAFLRPAPPKPRCGAEPHTLSANHLDIQLPRSEK